MSRDTLPRLLAENAAQHGPEIALSEKQFGIWRSFTSAQYHARTRLFALGLKRLGVQKGEVVALIGDNRPDWVMGEIAAHAIGCRSLGVYRDALDARLDPRGKPYYWIGGESPTGVAEEGTDFGALKSGYVSITPLQLDLTHYKAMDVLKKWKF